MAALQIDPNLFARAFADVDAVEGVYVAKAGQTYRVFTVINLDEEDVYDQIYDREKSLLRESDAPIRFNVIARRGRPVRDLIGDLTPIWQRSEFSCHNAMTI